MTVLYVPWLSYMDLVEVDGEEREVGDGARAPVHNLQKLDLGRGYLQLADAIRLEGRFMGHEHYCAVPRTTGTKPDRTRQSSQVRLRTGKSCQLVNRAGISQAPREKANIMSQPARD